jgi:hypothetical protein
MVFVGESASHKRRNSYVPLMEMLSLNQSSSGDSIEKRYSGLGFRSTHQPLLIAEDVAMFCK